MRSWVWVYAALGALAAASIGFFFFMAPPELDEGFIYANGHIEGTEISISAEVRGRVVKSYLEDGKTVEAGDVLVELDRVDAQSNLAKAQAGIRELEAGQMRLRAELATGQASLAVLRRDLARYTELKATGNVSDQRLDQVRTAEREVRGKVEVLDAQIQESDARIAAAASDVALLQNAYDKAVITAPISATILTKGIELGELAEPGRVVATLVDMNDLEVKVYVPEIVIGKIKLNDEVRLRVNAFPDRYFKGRVKRVDQHAQFTPRNINMPEERVRTVFGLTLAIDNSEGYLKPGMPADAWVRWDKNVDWAQTMIVPR